MSLVQPMACQQRMQYSSEKKTPPPRPVYTLPPKYAKVARSILSYFLPQYQAQNIGKELYKISSTYPQFQEFWVAECDLPESFQTWFSTSSLYVWMMLVRIRADPNAKHYNQELVDCFFRDAEKKIRDSGVKSGRIVNDTLKDLVSSYKGTVMSLDEGLVRSDAVLAAAIWRNLVPTDGAILEIDAVTKYVRTQLARLDKTTLEQLIQGEFSFDPIK
ncbi:hypothetical protein DL89DRAFT_289980 [Linderina pennispora]|uniref:Ubiquinol-cytochrome c chaperone domain-containing protein n=1 Tax=Linderina pennispora TaxID=61395 RepID=A0A1Y1WMI0_9FUNG|nr:uncharacterized protein DL89DRAFT_289980 [Linderina pennispora]ORX74416.1 hypothetical protein DL89DRAFT_289980 [Linderina pennispora]